MISSATELAGLLPRLQTLTRVAIDTEADSLHSYFEKLCLLQMSFDGQDYLIDPLAGFDLTALGEALAKKEIVLQGADFDLRLMRRTFGFEASHVFDTVIASRLIGLRAFSLAALVEKFFDVKLAKGSQKANWARRPLPKQMAEYAKNDTHYLLPLAEKLEDELKRLGRLDWFHQSCQRALDQAAVERVRDEEEAWRISGAGLLRGRAAAVLRSLWQWRDQEARAADRPPFHILQNEQLLVATEKFLAGEVPDYRHFSPRRRRTFRESGQRAMELVEAEWPIIRRRAGTRPTAEMERRAEQLRKRRDKMATELGLEPSFIASRGALDAIAADEKRSETLLVPWQRDLLGV